MGWDGRQSLKEEETMNVGQTHGPIQPMYGPTLKCRGSVNVCGPNTCTFLYRFSGPNEPYYRLKPSRCILRCINFRMEMIRRPNFRIQNEIFLKVWCEKAPTFYWRRVRLICPWYSIPVFHGSSPPYPFLLNWSIIFIFRCFSELQGDFCNWVPLEINREANFHRPRSHGGSMWHCDLGGGGGVVGPKRVDLVLSDHSGWGCQLPPVWGHQPFPYWLRDQCRAPKVPFSHWEMIGLAFPKRRRLCCLSIQWHTGAPNGCCSCWLLSSCNHPCPSVDPVRDGFKGLWNFYTWVSVSLGRIF